MLTKPFPIEDQPDVTSADSVSPRDLYLRDVPAQASDFGCLFMRNASGSSMTKSVFAVGFENEVIGANAVFGFAEMMDNHLVGDCPVGGFVGVSVGKFATGCFPVSVNIDESLPDMAGRRESSFFLNPRLGQAPVVSEEITEGLARNPAASGMAPRSDGRGISAPALAQTVAHNVEYTTVGGV